MRFLRLDSEKRAKKTRISPEKHLMVEDMPLENTCYCISAEPRSSPRVVPGFDCLVKNGYKSEDIQERGLW